MENFLKGLFVDFYSLAPFIKACAFIGVLYPLIIYSARLTKSFFAKKVGDHMAVLAATVVHYGGLVFLLVMVLHALGFNVTALVGAAGIFGIAIGFAAQTSVSNIISGIFLLLERPFSINDQIECNGIIGTVEAIDPLSVKLRTQSNQLVRIPNETLIKNSFINHTFYETRRIQISFKIRSYMDIEQVLKDLIALATENKDVFKKPAPQAFVVQVTTLSTNVVVRCWVTAKDASRVERELIRVFAEKYANSPERISIG